MGINNIWAIARRISQETGSFFVCLSCILVAVPTAHATIIGNIDSVGSKAITGWACDSGVATSIDVHVYATGSNGSPKVVTAGTTNIDSEGAINKACGTKGVKHRFRVALTSDHLARFGGQKVTVNGLSVTKGANFALGRSGEFLIPKLIVSGYVDRVAPLSGGASISGWACQRALEKPISVHLYIGGPAGTGTYVGSTVADKNNEAGVNEVCETTGVKHRFEFLLSQEDALRFSGQKVYVQGIHEVGEVPNALLARSGELFVPNSGPVMLSQLAKAGQDLTIPAGARVTIDTSIDVRLLTIAGRLNCPETGDFTLRTAGINVSGPGAAFECGTQGKRFAGNLRIALKPGAEIMGTERTFMVMNGGILRLSGQVKNSRWMRLSKTANVGDLEVTLPVAVAWSPGDQVVLGPSSYDFNEAEQLTVDSVKDDGKIVRFTTPLRYRHWGELQRFKGSRDWVVDERAEVANLTRNIVIYADGNEGAMDYRGGHVMVMRGSYGYVDGVEFFRMGRMGEMARYPFHWHRVGDAPGQFIVNSSIHRSFQRCVTVHGTNQTTVRNNVCYNHYGHGFFLEDGDETDNRIVRNLGMVSRKPLAGRHLLQSDIDTSFMDRFPGPATFWISNPKNDVYGNVAAGSEGTGFWNSFVPGIYCEPRSCKHPDPKIYPGLRPNIFPATEATLRFEGNIAHSSAVGMTWDGAPFGELTGNPNNREGDRFLRIVNYNPPVVPTFRNLKFHKNRNAAIYVRSTTSVFDNVIMADNRVGLFFAFNQVVTNSLVLAKSRNHTDEDYAINSEFTGARIYDGPFDFRNIDFINFPSEPIVFMDNTVIPPRDKTIIPTPINLYGGANQYTDSVQGLRFFPEPVRRISFGTMDEQAMGGWADLNTSPSVRDIDGSLSGRPNSLIVPDHPINDNGACVSLPGTRTLRCDQQRGLFIFSSQRDGSTIPFVVRRNDGHMTYALEQAPHFFFNNKFGVIVGDPRYEYGVTFPTGWTKSDPFGIQFHSEAMGQVSPVIALMNLGQGCALAGATPVSSIAQLRAASEDSYYSTGFALFVKMAATKRAWMGGSEYSHPAESNSRQLVCASAL